MSTYEYNQVHDQYQRVYEDVSRRVGHPAGSPDNSTQLQDVADVGANLTRMTSSSGQEKKGEKPASKMRNHKRSRHGRDLRDAEVTLLQVDDESKQPNEQATQAEG